MLESGLQVRGLAGVLAALLGGACGNDEGADPASEMYEVLLEIGRAECHQWFKCCPPREIALHDLLGTTERECIVEAEIGAILEVSDAGIAAGRTVFNVEPARAYLAALRSATCATPDALIERDSYQIIEPRVPVGGASSSARCASVGCHQRRIAALCAQRVAATAREPLARPDHSSDELEGPNADARTARAVDSSGLTASVAADAVDVPGCAGGTDEALFEIDHAVRRDPRNRSVVECDTCG
jgi:hypothetical protein